VAMTLASVGRRATPTRRTAPSATHTTERTRGGHRASGTAAPVAVLAITVGRRRRHETRRREGLVGVRGRELLLSGAANSAGISGSPFFSRLKIVCGNLGTMPGVGTLPGLDGRGGFSPRGERACARRRAPLFRVCVPGVN
jgi:hypothetical protein